ncbi:thioredoxin [Blautia sp. An249]|uniref:thioredoxin n=1 Tax=Blautia sp. An249 TaxID=1965603 RepID=UPI000B36B962|nr:thioredoxin [Blautia sp. An249]OUO80793.1 thioredoxin [Blautia sp. An249]
MAKTITKANFESDVLQAEGRVLVDFWATWCAPCRRQAGAIDELAAEGYQVGKIDVDQEPDLAGTFEVMSIPTLIVFEGGKEVKRFVGLQSKAVLEAALKE